MVFFTRQSFTNGGTFIMKKIYALLLIIVALALAGCETPNEPIADQNAQSGTSTSTRLAKGSNGRNYDGNRHGGDNCNRNGNHDGNDDCDGDHDGDHDDDHDGDDHDGDDHDGDHDDDDNCGGGGSGSGTCDEDGVVTLWAGKKYNAGSVTVTEDANNLYVKYTVTGSWKLKETHLDVATSKYIKRGSPGQYDYHSTHANGVTTHTYTVPKTWAPGTAVHFLAHAVVGKYSGNRCSSTETAYGGTVVSPRYGSWFATFCYGIEDTPPPPPTYSVNGVAFVDANSNGTQEPGEAGLANVSVSLTGGGSVLTDANGAYSFSGLTSGSYTVTAASVTGYTMSTSATANVTITSSSVTAVFGYVLIPPPTYSISGVAFVDANSNGTQESGEAGLANVSVSLTGGGSVLTDANGAYSFSGLTSGSYTVTAASVTGYTMSTSATANVTITSSSVTAVFGYVLIPPPPTYSITGVVYFDVNGNAVRDLGENGASGITITLNGSTNAVTDANGAYSFGGLAPGTYSVTAVMPSNYATTTVGTANVTITAANVTVLFGVIETGGPLSTKSVNARD